MKMYKAALALLASSLMLPAVAGCCGGPCGRRRTNNRRTRVVRTLAVVAVAKKVCTRCCGR